MDDKLKNVLGNPELMSRIAALIKGADNSEAAPVYTPAEPARPTAAFGADSSSDKALALLTALRPFLSQARQQKLESVTKAVAVANIYKNNRGV